MYNYENLCIIRNSNSCKPCCNLLASLVGTAVLWCTAVDCSRYLELVILKRKVIIYEKYCINS